MTRIIDISGAGARLEHGERGDNDVLRGIGWRWSPRLGMLVLPRSLRPETVDWKVTQTIERLVAAGHDPNSIAVVGRGRRESEDERKARLDQRDRDLIGVHEARAERAGTEADARLATARQLGDMIPMGQPILVDHYSAKRHRSHLAKIDTNMRKGVEAHKESVAEERLAESAAHRVARREAKAAGDQFGPDDFQVGDLINTQWSDSTASVGGPRLVLAVNKKSLTITSVMMGLPYTDSLPYRRVKGVHTKATPETLAAVKDAKAQVKAHRAQYKER